MKKITPYFILFAFLAIVFYDGFAFYDGGQEATISYLIITDWIYNYPFIVFAMGLVCGHLFWPLSRHKYEGKK